jgi:glycosyltransferase involved in cell wall biosynthesis
MEQIQVNNLRYSLTLGQRAITWGQNMNTSEIEANRFKISVVSAIDITLKVLLIAQIKAAQRIGYEVHGICTEGPNFNMLRQQGIRMYPVSIKRSISPFCDFVALWKMYRYFKREKIDIVHTHTPKCSLIGQLAAKLAGVPVIINTVHGFYFHDNMKPLKKWFFIVAEWVAGKCSTIILSQNPEDIETAVRLRICKRDKIKLLGNGVDLTKFNPDQFDSDFRCKKRIEIGVPEDAVIIGIIGRLVKEKGFLELLEAFREIIKKHDNIWLVIIGPEEPEKSDRILTDTFKEYGTESRVRYLGSRDDIPEILSSIDIYTLPSWREGSPRSAIEAAAMGLPIVTTDIRGCRQVVENNVNGLLVELRNSDELKDTLLQLIANPSLRKKMGEAGYNKAQKEFDEQKVCQIVLQAYKSCLKRINENDNNQTLNKI